MWFRGWFMMFSESSPLRHSNTPAAGAEPRAHRHLSSPRTCHASETIGTKQTCWFPVKKPNTWCPQSTALPLESRLEIQTMPTAVAPAGTESRSDWASLWMQPWGIPSPSPALSSPSCFASLTAAHLENSSRKKV